VKISTSFPFERFGLDQKQVIGPILENLGKNVGSIIGKTLNSIVNIFSNVILILIFLVFLLLSRAREDRPSNKVWASGEAKIKRYISSKLSISVLLGLCVGITLKALGIELAIVFGLFACILNFIPSIGPTIATILPLPVVLMTPEMSFMRGLLAIAVPGLLQFVFGNFIETKVMGDSLDLHPVTVLMSLIFWGMLWGIAGMFLAIPITAILKMIMEEIDVTKPAADLLAGRLH
ncbi:MAG: AI-2E family transporter, partial [Candidatus Omnitrophota bacterium]